MRFITKNKQFIYRNKRNFKLKQKYIRKDFLLGRRVFKIVKINNSLTRLFHLRKIRILKKKRNNLKLINIVL